MSTEHNNPKDNVTVSRELLQQILSFVEEGNPGHIADKINVLVKLRTTLEQPAVENVAALGAWYESLPGFKDSVFYGLKQANESATPQPQQPAPEINQCDGCRMGQELRNGLHIDRNGTAQMTCQAHRYKQSAPVQGQFTRDELDLLRQWFNSMQDTNGGYVIDADRKLHEKIAAELKTAPQPQQPVPVQEPVVTLCVKREADKLMLHYKRDEAALDLLDGEYKLYTAQPRKAVKLTDDEMQDLITENVGHGNNFDRVLRAVEQAVLKKNGVSE